MEWITDRLPPPKTRVLATLSCGSIRIVTCNEEKTRTGITIRKYRDGGRVLRREEVEAWMHLPERYQNDCKS